MASLKEAIVHIINSSKYSWAGLCVLWSEELAFRMEVFATLFLTPIILLMPITGFFKLFLFLMLMLLILIEAINTSIEATIDRISAEDHALSKVAKDLGSTAVFIALFMNFLCWVYALYAIFG